MGSLTTGDVTITGAATAAGPDVSITDTVIPKLEPGQEFYDSPSSSSPEPEASASTEPAPDKASQDPPPPVKRKGGRKPVRLLRRCSNPIC